jgi:hypothetical protein
MMSLASRSISAGCWLGADLNAEVLCEEAAGAGEIVVPGALVVFAAAAGQRSCSG